MAKRTGQCRRSGWTKFQRNGLVSSHICCTHLDESPNASSSVHADPIGDFLCRSNDLGSLAVDNRVKDSVLQSLLGGETVALQSDLALKAVVPKLAAEESSEGVRPVSTEVNL